MRPLDLCRLFFPPYEIAVAQWSFADVFYATAPKEKRGILLFDIVGHNEEDGKKLKGFLEQQVDWGFEPDAKAALIELKNRLKPSQDEYWNEGSAMYVLLEKDCLTLCNAGLPYPLQLTSEGLKVHETIGRPIWKDWKFTAPCYHLVLGAGEALIVYSDGVSGNYAYRNNEYVLPVIKKILEKKQFSSAAAIRDCLIEKLGNDIKPFDYDDDVSFVIVRNSSS